MGHESVDSRSFSQLSGRLDNFLFQRGFEQGYCSDITVLAFGNAYALHKIILDQSPFFSAMFEGDWLESKCSAIDLHFDEDEMITLEGFLCCLKYLYSRIDLPTTFSELYTVIATACYLGLDDLVLQCVQELLRLTHSLSDMASHLDFAVNAGKDYGPTTQLLIEVSKVMLCREGSDAPLEVWVRFPILITASVLSADAFFVTDEWTRYCITRELFAFYEHTEGAGCLRSVLAYGVHYMHLTFAQRLKVMQDRDSDGHPLVPAHVLYRSHWLSDELQHIITHNDEHSPSLNLCINAAVDNEEQTEVSQKSPLPQPSMSDIYYDVPQHDDTAISELSFPNYNIPFHIGEHAVYDDARQGDIFRPSKHCSKFPPFRFSVEFHDIDLLRMNKRVYSQTVYYAGSYWNVYIEKVRSKKNSKLRQLGVYLHRASEHATMRMLNGSDSRYADTQSTRVSSYSSQTQDSLDSFTQNSQDETERSVMNSSPAEIDSPTVYLDNRHIVMSYFSVYSPASEGNIGMSYFVASADTFENGQSWGWKSSTLYNQNELSRSIKFVIVLGLV
ncbi:hypothetical protein SJAG_03093 [Schizosaccharomyces japonicus yFS275]|uniref:BTB domain-containing protein n=1 Tax=Schizosaccharomyces japonicus (strain yFS275 / FY16936) TaxID=402676 RepID=B6K3A9_SCHJY|nr:hypothetical protein SJAG_03093 [Schizosaccharomyces japonicus yFS275]EEB07966.2 hypothetical protein SJAG_03093 [Schizosaccharomyces japonicus yFS275]